MDDEAQQIEGNESHSSGPEAPERLKAAKVRKRSKALLQKKPRFHDHAPTVFGFLLGHLLNRPQK